MIDAFYDPNQPPPDQPPFDPEVFGTKVKPRQVQTVNPQPPSDQPTPVKTTPARLTQPSVAQQFTPNYVSPDGSLGKPNWAITQTLNGQDLTKTPHMPNYDEMFGVIHGAGSQLANWGPRQLAPQYNALAMLARAMGSVVDYYSGGRFWRAFNSSSARVLEAQRQQYEMQREQMYDQGMQTVFAHKEMMAKYDKVFNMIEAMGGADMDPDELKRAEEVLIRLNGETGHGQLDSLVHAGKIAEVKRILDAENSKLLDMWSGILTLGSSRSGSGKTVKEDSEFDKSLISSPGTNLPSGPKKDEAPQGDYNNYLRKQYWLSDSGLSEAHKLFPATKSQDDGFLSKAKGPGGKQVISARNDMRNRIDDIAKGPGTEQEKLDQIGNIDPSTKGEVQGLLDYSANPDRAGMGPYKSIAHIVNPNYKEGNYKNANEFYDDKSRPSILIDKTTELGKTSIPVYAAMKNMPENTIITANQWKQLIANQWTGDPAYRNLYNALRQFGAASASLAGGTGQTRVTMVHDFLQEAPPTASMAQLRGLLHADLIAAASISDQQIDRWHEMRPGTKVPGLNQEAYEIAKYAAISNPYTGEMSKNAPDALKFLSKKPEPAGSKNRPKWLTEEMAYPPVDSIEDYDMLIHAHNRPGDPNAEGIIKFFGNRYLGF